MHTLKLDDGWLVIHHGDFSGDLMIRSPRGCQHHEEGAEHWMPFHVLAAIVAEKIRRDRIAALEDASDDDLLA